MQITAAEYSKACETLGYTTPKSPAENAQLAKSRLAAMGSNGTLREKAACKVLIQYASQGSV